MEQHHGGAAVEVADVIDPDQVGGVDRPAFENCLEEPGRVEGAHVEYFGAQEPDAVETRHGVGAPHLHHRGIRCLGEGFGDVGSQRRLADTCRTFEEHGRYVRVVQECGNGVDRLLTPDEGPPAHGPKCTQPRQIARMAG